MDGVCGPCGRCANHMKLVSSIYPTAAGASEPNANELSKLKFYCVSKPLKLPKVAAALAAHTDRDAARLRVGWVRITLAVAAFLVADCRQHLNLFADAVLRILRRVLETPALGLASECGVVFQALVATYDFQNDDSVDGQLAPVVLLFAQLARDPTAGSRSLQQQQQNISQPSQAALRNRSVGLRAIRKLVDYPDYVASGYSLRTINTVIPSVLSNIHVAVDVATLPPSSSSAAVFGGIHNMHSPSNITTVDSLSSPITDTIPIPTPITTTAIVTTNGVGKKHSGSASNASKAGQSDDQPMVTTVKNNNNSPDNSDAPVTEEELQLLAMEIISFYFAQCEPESLQVGFRAVINALDETRMWEFADVARSIIQSAAASTPAQHRHYILTMLIDLLEDNEISKDPTSETAVVQTLIFLMNWGRDAVAISVMELLETLTSHLYKNRLALNRVQALHVDDKTAPKNTTKSQEPTNSVSRTDAATRGSPAELAQEHSMDYAALDKLQQSLMKAIGTLALHIAYPDQANDIYAFLIGKMQLQQVMSTDPTQTEPPRIVPVVEKEENIPLLRGVILDCLINIVNMRTNEVKRHGKGRRHSISRQPVPAGMLVPLLQLWGGCTELSMKVNEFLTSILRVEITDTAVILLGNGSSEFRKLVLDHVMTLLCPNASCDTRSSTIVENSQVPPPPPPPPPPPITGSLTSSQGSTGIMISGPSVNNIVNEGLATKPEAEHLTVTTPQQSVTPLGVSLSGSLLMAMTVRYGLDQLTEFVPFLLALQDSLFDSSNKQNSTTTRKPQSVVVNTIWSMALECLAASASLLGLTDLQGYASGKLSQMEGEQLVSPYFSLNVNDIPKFIGITFKGQPPVLNRNSTTHEDRSAINTTTATATAELLSILNSRDTMVRVSREDIVGCIERGDRLNASQRKTLTSTYTKRVAIGQMPISHISYLNLQALGGLGIGFSSGVMNGDASTNNGSVLNGTSQQANLQQALQQQLQQQQQQQQVHQTVGSMNGNHSELSDAGSQLATGISGTSDGIPIINGSNVNAGGVTGTTGTRLHASTSFVSAGSALRQEIPRAQDLAKILNGDNVLDGTDDDDDADECVEIVPLAPSDAGSMPRNTLEDFLDNIKTADSLPRMGISAGISREDF